MFPLKLASGALRRRLGAVGVAHAARAPLSSSAASGSSSVYTWGNGDSGQLGQESINKSGLTNSYSEPAPKLVPGLEHQGVTEISCGKDHTAAVTSDGRVLTWGKVTSSLLGHDGGKGDSHCLQPHQVAEGLEGVRAARVLCGESHTAVLSAEGGVYTWGWGGSFVSGSGALGLGDTEERARPERVLFGGSADVRIAKLASGKNHVLALGVEGELWSWGQGGHGRLGNGGTSDQLEPFPVELFLDLDSEVVDIACGGSFSLALTKDGRVWSWGKNEQSQLGLGGGISMDVYAMEDIPQEVDTLGDERIVAVGAGNAHALAITEQGEVYFWGSRTWIEPHKMTALAEQNVVQVCGGDGYSLALSDTGSVFSWGKGFGMRQSGVLGHGDTSRHAQPEELEALKGVSVATIAAGARHAAAVTVHRRRVEPTPMV